MACRVERNEELTHKVIFCMCAKGLAYFNTIQTTIFKTITIIVEKLRIRKCRTRIFNIFHLKAYK